MSPAKTTEPIEMPLRRVTWVDPRNRDKWGPDPQEERASLGLSDLYKSIASHCCGERSENQPRHHCNCCSRLHCSRLAGITLTFSREKNSLSLRCGVSSKFFDHPPVSRHNEIKRWRRSWPTITRSLDSRHSARTNTTPHVKPVRWHTLIAQRVCPAVTRFAATRGVSGADENECTCKAIIEGYIGPVDCCA